MKLLKQEREAEDYLCRGARNYQLEISYCLGYSVEANDECWNDKRLPVN